MKSGVLWGPQGTFDDVNNVNFVRHSNNGRLKCFLQCAVSLSGRISQFSMPVPEACKHPVNVDLWLYVNCESN